jgi:hypothetical protein
MLKGFLYEYTKEVQKKSNKPLDEILKLLEVRARNEVYRTIDKSNYKDPEAFWDAIEKVQK